MPGKPEISVRELLEDLEGDEELLTTILQDFCEEYEGLHEVLREALKEGNPPLASRTAHSMKSGLGTLGWAEGVEMADNIHRLCHGENLQEASEAMKTFDPLLSEFLKQVREKRLALEKLTGGKS
ncbi:MAG TPA: Hpt domain-containing protein [Synergistaceae bacterium]|nr:Hpt domain-containing protein [Synergistaceae bacterium]HPJ25043.1 Hpt domain-containing protein [Synergistaceae bacterium]HPQ36671.1 Hpt domain-containing protein [Synergistaceae bacterium]